MNIDNQDSMGIYFKPYTFRLAQKSVNKALYKLNPAMVELIDQMDGQRASLIEQYNQRAARVAAEELGITPINNEDELRTLINNRIITEIKKRKLRHVDAAVISRMHRPRITSIMNRRIKSVSTDTLIRLANCLGITVKITLG